jgi:hypothetical protein
MRNNGPVDRAAEDASTVVAFLPATDEQAPKCLPPGHANWIGAGRERPARGDGGGHLRGRLRLHDEPAADLQRRVRVHRFPEIPIADIRA